MFAEFKPLYGLSFPGSTYYLYGFVVGRLLVPTGMATSDLLLRLLHLLVMLLDCMFSSLAPDQLSPSGLEAALAYGPGRTLSLTT